MFLVHCIADSIRTVTISIIKLKSLLLQKQFTIHFVHLNTSRTQLHRSTQFASSEELIHKGVYLLICYMYVCNSGILLAPETLPPIISPTCNMCGSWPLSSCSRCISSCPSLPASPPPHTAVGCGSPPYNPW